MTTEVERDPSLSGPKPGMTIALRWERRANVARLYARGWFQSDIGKELKLSPRQVQRDLDTIQRYWQRSTLVDFDKAKARELAKIDHLERECWDAWDRSKKDREARHSEVNEEPSTTQNAGQPPVPSVKLKKKIRVTTEGQVGESDFLRAIQWCIDKRCEIIGLYAPLRGTISLEKKDGAKPYHLPAGELLADPIFADLILQLDERIATRAYLSGDDGKSHQPPTLETSATPVASQPETGGNGNGAH